MKRFLTLFLLLFTLGLSAQQSELIELRGRLVERGTERPIVSAILSLEPSTPLPEYSALQAVSDDKGYFILAAPRGQYALLLQYQGQRQTLLAKLELTEPRDLGVLHPEITRQLSAVEVTAQAPTFRYQGSRVVISGSQWKQAAGGTALTMLRQLPGITQHGDQLPLLYGLTEMAIYVDGRSTSHAPVGSVLAFLQNLPMEQVESIELILQPMGSFDRAPGINIRRRRQLKDMMLLFGQGSLVQQHYLSGHLALRLDLERGRHRGYGYYSFNSRHRLETLDLTLRGRDYQDRQEQRPLHVHQLGLGDELQLTQEQHLGLQLLYTRTGDKLYHGSTLRQLEAQQLYSTLYHQLQREHFIWETSAELSLHGDELSYPGRQLDGAPAGMGDNSLERRERSTLYQLKSAIGAMLTESLQLSTGVELQGLGHRHRYQRQSEEGRASEHYLRGFATLNQTVGAFSWELSLSLLTERRRIEPAASSGTPALDYKQDKVYFTPSFFLAYQLAPRHRLELQLLSDKERPQLGKLMPYEGSVSSHLVRTGNPELRTALWHQLQLAYSYRRAARLELSYRDMRHPLVEALDGLTLRPTNLDYTRYLRALIALPLPLYQSKGFSWWTQTYLVGQRQWDAGSVLGTPFSAVTNAGYLMHKHQLGLADSWYLDLSFTYYSALRYQLFAMQPQYFVDGSLSHVRGPLRIELATHDLFGTNKARGRYDIGATQLDFVNKWYTPQVSLSLYYSFGSRKLKENKLRAEEQADRLRSGAEDGLQVTTGR